MQIDIKSLSYSYPQADRLNQVVLRDISVELEAQKWVMVIGQTGSGKSTLVQHLNGTLRPTSGTIQVGNHILSSKRKKQRPLYQDVGMVFQFAEHQLFEETVAKEIAYGPTNLEWPKELISKRVAWAIEQVGLDASYLERSPFSLSGGEKRRVAIAGVLVMQPKLLILDEPTAGLDPAAKHDILEMLKRWKKENGRSIIMITHQMDHVLHYADEVLVLAAGKVIYQLDPVRLFSKHARQLEELGLAIPKIIQLIQQLNQRLPAPIPIYSKDLDELIQSIAERCHSQETGPETC